MRLLELYTSVQGEGPNVGKPTTFVRFAGCNYRCPGWPCDTPYSIFPDQYRREQLIVDPDDLFLMIAEKYPKHICITGGEPLIQPQRELLQLIQRLWTMQYTWDIFTNGSQLLEPYVGFKGSSIIMDWKLAGSGHGLDDLEMRNRNIRYLARSDALKFVVKNRNDLHEMKQTLENLNMYGVRVYVSPAWNMIEPAEIVEFLDMNNLHNVWLNLQTHKYIFDPDARRI